MNDKQLNRIVDRLSSNEESLFQIIIGNVPASRFHTGKVVKSMDSILKDVDETAENHGLFWAVDDLRKADDDAAILSSSNTLYRAIRDFRGALEKGVVTLTTRNYSDGYDGALVKAHINTIDAIIPTLSIVFEGRGNAYKFAEYLFTISQRLKEWKAFKRFSRFFYNYANKFEKSGCYRDKRLFDEMIFGLKTYKDKLRRRPDLANIGVFDVSSDDIKQVDKSVFFDDVDEKAHKTTKEVNTMNESTSTTTTTSTTGTSTTTSTSTSTSTAAQLLAKWGRLKNARKDVVRRFVELKNETIDAFSASTYLTRIQKITSENIDFDSDARKLASRVYTLLLEVLNTTEPTTKPTPETVDTKEPETKPETTIETSETTETVETTAAEKTAVIPTGYVVKSLDNVKNGAVYRVLTSLEESDKTGVGFIVAYCFNGDNIAGVFVDSKVTHIKAHAYLVSESNVLDKSQAVFSYYKKDDFDKLDNTSKSGVLTVCLYNMHKNNPVNIENVDGYLVPVNIGRVDAIEEKTPEKTPEPEKAPEKKEPENPAPRLSLKKDDEPAPRVEIGKKLGAALKRYNKRQEENAAFIRSIKSEEKNETVETAPRSGRFIKLSDAIERFNKEHAHGEIVVCSIPKDNANPAPVNAAAVKSPAPVNVVNAVKDVNPVANKASVETFDKSTVYIWKEGKKYYAKTPGKRPSDACLAILRNSKGYFDKGAGRWTFTHGLPAQAIDALKKNGARVVESAELVPGYDPAKLDLADRILYEWKRGRVSWLEGCRFNLTYRPASYFDGHTFSARNSELCFNLPTYFLTRSTARKVADETGLEITLKENAPGFPVRVPRFENDEENEEVETLAGFRWEIAYPQEAFNNLPLKQFNAPDVPALEVIAERIGAAVGENLLDALRRRLANAPELVNLYPDRRALALDVAACVLLASFGLNPAGYAGDISAYRAKFAGAVLAQNGVRVAINKAKELARRVGKEIGLPIVEDAETTKA